MAGTNEAFLIHAAAVGSLADVKAALKAGADIDVNKQVVCYCTERVNALFLAARNGHVDVVELLLRKGASIIKRTEGAYTPLHGAAMHGQTKVVEVLVHHGATVDVRDGYQITPIMYACKDGHIDTVRRLIEFGARVDLVDDDNISVLNYSKTDSEPDTEHGFLKLVQRTLEAMEKKCGNPECGKPGSEKEGDSNQAECTKLIQEALEKKQLRCCNPKCGKPGKRSTLKLCGGCKLTRYCSRECQKHHWSVGHKKCCGHDKCSVDRDLLSDLGDRIFLARAQAWSQNT